jgi:hypothetical protein
MKPDDVAEVYRSQAKLLMKFIDKVQTENFNNDDLKFFFIMIARKYYELLVNLSVQAKVLEAYNVKFHELSAGENLDEPPFEKDFFNNKNF